MIIKNGIILTMDEKNRILKNHSIVIEGNEIKKIVKTNKLNKKDYEINAKGKIVMPGFISTHTHCAHTFLRGFSEEGKGLKQWIKEEIFDRVSKCTEKEVYNSVRLWHKEAIRAGITTLLDSADLGARIYRPSLEAHKASGMRVTYGYCGKNIEKVKQLNNKYKSELITICPAPEILEVSEDTLKKSVELAKELKVPLTTHCSEIKEYSTINKMPTIEYLNSIGFLTKRTILAHCTWITDKEIKLLKKKQTKVAHNPTANAFLADGIMPFTKMKGIIIGIGMDDPNCNSNVNMIQNLKTMCLIQKSKTLNPKAITAEKALRMATIEGAKCIGMDKEIGSIKEGKKADIIVIDTNGPNQIPFKNPFFNLVYQCYGNEIIYTIINGKIVWKNPKASN